MYFMVRMPITEVTVIMRLNWYLFVTVTTEDIYMVELRMTGLCFERQRRNIYTQYTVEKITLVHNILLLMEHDILASSSRMDSYERGVKSIQ